MHSSLNPDAIRSLLQDHVRTAAHALSGMRAPSDEAVHGARKAIKRARALLRLLRSGIDRADYRRENIALRNVARPLSRLRDAVVMNESLDVVRKDRASRAAAPELGRALRRERLETRREVLERRRRARLVLALNASQRRIAAWPAPPGGDLLIDALRRIYRKGCKALERARREPSEGSLHEARKQVKYLELALAPFRTGRHARRIERLAVKAESIEEDLGRSHDFAVLRARIEPMVRTDETRGSVVVGIDRRRGKLDRRALAAGRRLYTMAPKRFARRLRPMIAVESDRWSAQVRHRDAEGAVAA